MTNDKFKLTDDFSKPCPKTEAQLLKEANDAAKRFRCSVEDALNEMIIIWEKHVLEQQVELERLKILRQTKDAPKGGKQ